MRPYIVLLLLSGCLAPVGAITGEPDDPGEADSPPDDVDSPPDPEEPDPEEPPEEPAWTGDWTLTFSVDAVQPFAIGVCTGTAEIEFSSDGLHSLISTPCAGTLLGAPIYFNTSVQGVMDDLGFIGTVSLAPEHDAPLDGAYDVPFQLLEADLERISGFATATLIGGPGDLECEVWLELSR